MIFPMAKPHVGQDVKLPQLEKGEQGVGKIQFQLRLGHEAHSHGVGMQQGADVHVIQKIQPRASRGCCIAQQLCSVQEMPIYSWKTAAGLLELEPSQGLVSTPCTPISQPTTWRQNLQQKIKIIFFFT